MIDELPDAWLQQAPARIEDDDLGLLRLKVRKKAQQAACLDIFGGQELRQQGDAKAPDRRVAKSLAAVQPQPAVELGRLPGSSCFPEAPGLPASAAAESEALMAGQIIWAGRPAAPSEIGGRRHKEGPTPGHHP